MKRIFLFEKVEAMVQKARASAPVGSAWMKIALLASVLGIALFGLSGIAVFDSNQSESASQMVLTDGWVLILKMAFFLMIAAFWGSRHTFFRRVLQKLEPSYPTASDVAAWTGKKSGQWALMFTMIGMMGTSALMAQSGTAFRDFNGDGLQTGAEPGAADIIVRIYGDAAPPAKDVFIGETVTDANGNFNFATLVTSGRAANPGEKVRVEFTIPVGTFTCDVDQVVDFTGQGGAAYGTSVQFITGQQSGVKFAINYPGQWVENPDPTIMLPCYSFGEPTFGGNAGAAPAFISYPYSRNGIPQSHSGGYPGVPNPNLLATIGEVGSLYGVAFSRPAQKVFTSAVLRRHAAFGPLGSGGIYLVDPFSAAADKTTDWLNLDAIGIWTYNHAGSYPAFPGNNTSPNGQNGFIGTSLQRGLGANNHDPSTDYAAGDQVGKVSIGDIDISDDGRYLYVTNLYDRKIYEIDMIDPSNPQAPTLGNVASRVRSWDVPNPATSVGQGANRPWGLKWYRGKLYLGEVLCGQDLSGQVVSPVVDVNGQKVGTELRGYVYEFDPASQLFTVRLNFSLNYGRERGWIPWGYSTQSPLSRYFSGEEREIAEPIISDIEFDDQGNMLIGLLDRKGHIYAINNNNFNGALVNYEYSTAGELLRAEPDGNCTYSIVTRPGTTDYYADNIIHPESLQGPLAVLPGGGDAVAVVLDPIDIRSGGTIRFDNVTGARVPNSAYEVFDDRFTLSQPGATPSKANGLGDVELSGDEAPIEIGNRVWADMDQDGIQDSGEPGVPGVHVQLKTPAGNVLATVTTDGNGNFFFNDSNVPDGDPLTPGNQPGLLPLTAYKICILATEFGNGQPLNNFIVTTPDLAGTGLADYSDSDGVVQGNGDVQIMLTTGNSGENNHTYDFGVIPSDFGDLPDTYGTTEPNNGASHLINTNLKLGACVDGETDGQPEPMAGMMTGGDDNTVGLVNAGTCGQGGDDENGITFTTPLIPGSTACVNVNAMNMTGSAAYLYGWIDFNGDGTFGPGEQLNTGSFAGGAATVPAGGLTDASLCFTVPSGATFQGGVAFSRFRLSPNTGLTPNGPGGNGEVEDYKLTLAKIGNLVWTDFNDNGIQNTGETGINNVDMTLTYYGPDQEEGGGDDRTYTTVTATMGSDGVYMFLGLIPGNYQIAPTPPAGYIPGKENQGGNDVTDSDLHAGQPFTIPDNIVLPTGENGLADNPGGTNGFPDSQDNLTFDFNYVGLDYGDLPDTYGTTTPNGPAHAVTPNLKLGTRVDAEANGNPEPMAGMMTGGDDNSQGAPAFGGAGDDEDGIVFSSPLVPGAQACISVTAMNMTTAPARLQGWIDWNGNGQFEGTEQLTTVDFTAPGAVIPTGMITNQQFCFMVPADAQFASGNIMSRFRLSPDGGLTATGGLPNGGIPLGEVEDHKAPTAKIGNFVWWDWDNDGIQDEPASTGINGVTVQLTWAGPDGNIATAGDNVVFTDVTAFDNGTGANGVYAFCGLIPGNYTISIPTPPANYVPTQTDQGGNDFQDSDNPAGTPIVIPNPPTTLPTNENGVADNPGDNFPDNQDALSYDFGYVAYDYGDLPDTYGTTNGNNGASQLLNPNLYLGTCVDAETNGQPEPMAGLMSGGDDNNATSTLMGSCGQAADDENGIVSFETPMILGYQACVRVTAVNTTGQGAVLQGWIDWNGDGQFQPTEQLNTGSFAPAGAPIPNGGVTNQQMCFDVPPTATFQGGQAFIRFRLSQNGGQSATGPAAIGGVGEVEDYKVALAKVGNYVWNDWDNNGQQNEPGVAGLNNITVNLLWAGTDLAFGTGDDRLYTTTTATEATVEGKYNFCGLIPGSYKISLPTLPTNYIATQLNIGSDVSDSDDPAGQMVMIPALPGLPTGENATGDNPGAINGFPDAQDNLTVDFGLITRDFGDAPDTYGTTDDSPNDGPVHVLNPNLKLGACADGDPDGQPDPMAGLMSGGDDNNSGVNTDGTASTCGDDDDGIMLVSPLVPGSTATIMVTAMNMLGANAVLQGWIDYNGDGDFNDANEALTFTNVNGGTVPSPAGLDGAKLTFVVPAAATFTGGNAFMRFRISPAGGLTPNGPENMPFPIGEVEDYKVPLAKIGNYVWNDNNNDGIQNEPGSNGLNGTTVQLVWPGPDADFATVADNLTYTVVTSNMNGTNGQYMFLGLTPGMYKASIPTHPAGFIPTQLNQGGNDVTDSDDPAGQMVVIPNPPTTLPTGENGTGDVPNDPNFPDAQNDLTIDFGFVSVDHGDLPSSYGTTNAENGPQHIVNPNLKLGSSVDGELDGQPEAMAGLMTGGDDGNNGGYNEGGAGDDENGVTFLTPMIPGYQACVRVNTMNTLGGTAVLQGWIDWNGDGDVADPGEELSTGAFAAAANGAIVPAGASVNTDFCFDVPATATFQGGQAFARFRLSPTGGLASGGPATMPFPIGEVEDYKVPLAKAGNYVWIDANINGIQDENGVLGINNVTVELQWAGPDGNFATVIDNRTYTDVTAAEAGINGKYLFCGLIPGNYRMVVPPFGYVPTLVIDVAGNTQDVVDADNPAGVNFTVPNPPTTLPTGENGTGDTPLIVNGFPDNQANFTFDFGYLGFDFGDLPESYGTTQGAGNPGPDGAVHTVNPNLYLGPSVDVDIDGQPEAMAGFMTGGDDGNTGPGTLGTSTPAGDDENGISFPTPLIPGNQACVKVTARNATGSAAVLQAWIDWNGDNQFQVNEQLTTGNFTPAGASIPNGGVTNQNFCFDVPADAVFTSGNLFARFRLSQTGGTTATGPAIPGNGVFPTGEVEDYKLPLALIGNYVWMDNPDIEGDQDATEMPLENVKINLTWAGEDGVFQTAVNSSTPQGDDRVYMDVTDATGRYEFRGLIPSTTYRVMPDKYTAANAAAGAGVNPTNKILTIPNLPAGDNVDSDGAPSITITIPNLTNGFLPTGENGLQDVNSSGGFPDNQTNLSLDFGFIDEPKIAAALAIKGFQKASSGTCGHFDVIMDLCVKNNSTAPLASIQAALNMAAANAYGTAFLGIVPSGAPQIVSSNAQQNPVLNASYTGVGANINLFNGTSGLLWPGEQVCIRFRFEVDPLATGAPSAPKAQATVTGKAQNFQGVPIPDYFNGGAQYVATDLSDAGMDAMTTNPDDPSDLGTANDPTLLGNCWQITQDIVGNDLLHVSISDNCEVLINSTQVLEGEIDECTEQVYPLGGFYQVTVFNAQNQPVPNPVPLSYIGQTLTYKATHIMTCNTTWGHFILEDKLPPVIECSNITLSCAITNYTPAYLHNVLGFENAYPNTFDCTALSTPTYVDTWFDLGCDSENDLSAYVERIWTVRDSWGNQSSCTQYIYFERRHVDDVLMPADVTIDCSDFTATPGHPTPDPSVTGTPYIEDFGLHISVFPNGTYCELSANYTDEVYEVCEGSFKVLRTWSVVDWCLPHTPVPPYTNPYYYIQLIKVLDSNGPQIACPADLTVATNPSQCCATVNLPDVIISDDCSRVDSLGVKIYVFDQYTGDLIATQVVSGYLSDFPNNNYWNADTLGVFGYTQCLPIGTHLVEYLAKDACGNYSTCSFYITVKDYIPPVATCTQFTTVAIGGDDPNDCYVSNEACQGAGVTWVPASAFNQGSYDNCNGLYFTIRRMPEADSTYSDCIDGLEPLCDGYEYNVATAESDSIKFYCCEVGTTQTVILRVYQTDLYGQIMYDQDENPIYNECMVNVEVQDKISPTCQAPAHVTINCENFEPSLWAYGYPEVNDNCCLDETPPTSADPQGQVGIPSGTLPIPGVCGATQKVYYNNFLNANFDTTCNRGILIRRFTAWDCSGFSSVCTQRVTVDYIQDYSIVFPADVSVNCTTEPNIGKPVITNDEGCELIGTSYNDVVFTVVPDACYKIERTWTIINWCTYNADLPCYAIPRNPVNQTTGLAPAKNWRVYLANEINDENCVTYKQIIKVLDQTPPTVECKDIDTCDVSTNNARYWNDGDNWWDNGTMQHDLCEKETDIAVTAEDLCDTLSPEGGLRFRYLLFLDLDNDGIMETVVSSADIVTRPLGQVLYGNYNTSLYHGGTQWVFDNTSTASQRYRFDIEQSATGARVIWRNASGTKLPELAHGRHKIKWIAEDGCGNEAVCEKTFEIRDCKPPVVACSNVNINLMVGGMATLWATDFYQYGDDNCTPDGILDPTLTVIRADENPNNTYPADQPQSIIVTCADQGTQVPVQVWLQDAAGNADFCIAYVDVQANIVGCETTNATVAGALATENQQGVEDADVELAMVSPNGQQGIVTQNSTSSGTFQFPNAVPMSGDYTLTPTKDDNPLNGVTTYDLVLINKHILGLEPLPTPYKMIAADANRSGSITTFDIVEFRKLILGIYNELPNNTSWRFVDKDHQFADPSNPFSPTFPENISVADMQTNNVADDFVGVKIGDVNNTVIANSLQSAEERTAATMLFDVDDRTVKAGEVFTVNFKGAERVQGYQFTMNLNGLEVMDIAGTGDIKTENFGVFGDAVTTSVDGTDNEFSMTFRAAKTGRLSQMLGVSSRITKAEAYNLNNDRLDVAFRFNTANGSTISGVGFELYQNQPNPFVNKTFIGFHLPEATSATLRVFDENGRLIFTQTGSFAKGYNSFAIDRQLITTTGMLYYSVETDSDSATKKMIQSK
ncbi:MAG: T9SS type A sorting domain-containing protein [Saprospiraceae bacterium]|nr:T9SS type A sorting domain-containing protein [Saprospiraceae bacterium]